MTEQRPQDSAADAEVQPREVPDAPWRIDRAALVRTTLVTALSFLAAFAIGAIVIVASNPEVLETWGYFFARPSDALGASWDVVASSYGALLRGSLGSPRALSETIVAATPLILTGLSVTLAFRAGLFNIGGEGQLILGAMVAGAIGFALHLPPVIHVLLAVLGGFVGGAVWGAIPGYLKAKTGAHEVITTIMLNYVAYNLVLMFLKAEWVQREGRADPISEAVDATAQLPAFVSGLRVNWGILIALLAAAAIWWLLNRSTVGFEFRAVGLNNDAARTAGMSVERTWTLSMLIAGGLAGLAGGAQLLGIQRSLAPGFSSGLGFDGITVALLGRASPVGTVLAGLLFGALEAGGLAMQASTGTSLDLVTVIQSLIVLFIAAPALVRAMFRLRVAPAGGDQALSKGWAG